MRAVVLFFLISTSALTSDLGYVAQAIACDECHESFVAGTYDAFLAIKAERRIPRGRLRYPAALAVRTGRGVIVSRSFYVSPNELRGFEIFIPNDTLEEKDGILAAEVDLEVESEDTRQGITCLVLKRSPSPSPAIVK